MKILFQKPFKKRYVKLSSKMQEKVDDVILKFRKNPTDPVLKNHALKGSMKGKRSFSVTGGLRIIFKEKGDYMIVFMLDVGGHNQVYDS